MSIFSFVSRFFAKTSNKVAPKKLPIRRNSVGLGFENLEDRINPAPVLASYAQQALPRIQVVQSMQTDITVAKITETAVLGFAPTAVRLNAPLGNFGAMSFNLGIDYNKDGVIDYPNVSGTAPGPVATATLPIPGWVQSLSTSYPSMNLVVTATTQNKSQGYVGVNVTSVDFGTLWGSPVPTQYVQRTGNFPSYLYVQANTHGQLSISGQSLGSGTVAVRNETNVPVYRETILATQDSVRYYHRTFVAAQGNIANATSYSYGVDNNRDGVIDTYLAKNVAPSAGKVDFNFNYILPRNASGNFLVTANIAPSLINNVLQLCPDVTANAVGAEDSDDGRDLVGLRVNGTPATGDISLTTVAGPVITIVNSGTLTVSQSPTPVLPDYLLLGTEGQRGLRAVFTTMDEDVYLTKVHVLVNTPGSTSLDRVAIYQVTSGGLVLRAHATVAGLGTEATPFQAGKVFAVNIPYGTLMLPKGTSSEFVFLPVAKSDVDGGKPGDVVTLQIVSLTGYQPVSGIGRSSSNIVSVSIGSGIASPAFYLTGSKIGKVLNGNPDADGTSVPNGITGAGQFQVHALANANSKNGLNKAVVNEFVFWVTAQNVDLDPAGFRLYNKADSSLTVSASSAVLAGDTWKVSFYNLETSWVNTMLDQGTYQTFVLQVNVRNPKILSNVTSVLRVGLLTDQMVVLDKDAGGVIYNTGLFLADPIVWSTKYIA